MTYHTLLKCVGTAALLCFGAGTAAQAQTILTTSDGIIRNSLCVGGDCQSGISFSDSTLILKENNTRIKFADTSVTGNPNNDWEIEANSSVGGGANYWGINDCGAASNDGGCATNLVFAIEAGARANALYVDDAGQVGLGTSTPSVELHVVDGNTPTLRLDQNASAGFQAQVWDVAGNETNFFIRDTTNGSQLPFKIRPGAATNSIVIDPEGDVGMGTSTPDGALHIRRTANAYVTLENSTSGRKWYFTHENAAAGRFIIGRDDAGPKSLFVGADGSLRVGGNGSAGNGMVLAANGNLTIGGNLTQNSDKNSKMAIVPIDSGEILDKVAALPVSSWTYKTEAETGIRHIGPMAQDFYATFGTGADETGISTIDTGGVALAAIQALAAQNAELRARITSLERAQQN